MSQLLSTLRRGSSGPNVGKLQLRLTESGLYRGPADNAFGIGVETAVRAFQSLRGLPADGIVGPQTWSALFPPSTSAPSAGLLSEAPLAERCLALTGAFETSAGFPDCFAGIAGDFDGQGLSFGVLQWNIGQGTLQPLLAEMLSEHKAVAAEVCGDRLDAVRAMLVAPLTAQLQWARSLQDPVSHRVLEPWLGMLLALGRTPEFQAVQVEHAAPVHTSAVELCTRFGVTTERALAMMFDIRVQNGSISSATEARIRADFAAIPAGGTLEDVEVTKLRSIANRRAEASSPTFREDVRVRKLTIANGYGTVHGVDYDLERQFGIRLQTAT